MRGSTDSDAEAVDRDGWAVLADAMTGDELAQARGEVGSLIDRAEFGGNPFDGFRTRRVWALLAKTRAFDKAIIDRILPLVERLIGPGVQFGLTLAVQIHPEEVPQRLHFDQGIYPLPRDRDVLISTIWALDDFTEANGATRVVTRSHLDHERDRPEGDAVPVVMSAGSVLVYSGRLWHGGGPNTTGSARLGVIIDFVVPWLRPCEDHTHSMDPELVRALPVRLQELAGFNQPSPYFGFINGRHPRKWLEPTPEQR